ncbi:MAG: hypothetical protein ACJ72O_06115 [Marmoricola sp.]
MLAAAIFSSCVLAGLGTLLLLVVGIDDSTPGDSFGLSRWGGLNYVVMSLTFAGVGALVLARLPGNRVGWVLCITGVAVATGDLTYQYADQALYGSLQNLPAGPVAAWYQNLGMSPTFGLVGLMLLLFPDGRLPSRRWWPAAAAAIVGSLALVAGYALRPGPLDPPFKTAANPLGVPGWFALTDWMAGLGWILTGVSVVAAAAALRSRFKRAQGLERLQLRWATLAAAVAGVIVALDVASFMVVPVSGFNQLRDVALGIAVMTFPVATGVAILRFHLYDIDVFINRTLVYATLTAALAGVYLGSILLLQLALSAFTSGSGLAVAASTLATAALVRPARAQIQEIVDRRFFRRKYDAARTLETFGTHVRSQVDLDAVTAELRAVVADTMQPAHLTLWVPAHLSMTNSRNDFRTQNR